MIGFFAKWFSDHSAPRRQACCLTQTSPRLRRAGPFFTARIRPRSLRIQPAADAGSLKVSVAPIGIQLILLVLLQCLAQIKSYHSVVVAQPSLKLWRAGEYAATCPPKPWRRMDPGKNKK